MFWRSTSGDLYTMAGLLLFATMLLLAASWQILDNGRSLVERELDAIAASVAKARDCGVAESAISTFVKHRIDALRQQNPEIRSGEIIGGLLERLGAIPREARKEPIDCAREWLHVRLTRSRSLSSVSAIT
jgi:hypothetical protein